MNAREERELSQQRIAEDRTVLEGKESEYDLGRLEEPRKVFRRRYQSRQKHREEKSGEEDEDPKGPNKEDRRITET